MSTLIARLSFERAHQIETEVELWKPSDSEEAEWVSILEEFVRQNIELGQMLGRAWGNLRNKLFGGKLGDVVVVGTFIGRAFHAAESVFTHLERPLAEAKRRGYKINDYEDWAIERNMLKRRQQEFSSEWPQFDPQTIEASMADLKAGDILDEEELLSAAKGHRSKDDGGKD